MLHKVIIMTEHKKKSNFNIEYRRVKRASSIEKIKDHVKVSISWGTSDTVVYSTLLSMFNAYGGFTVSYDFLAGECNLNSKTVGTCARKMIDFELVTVVQDHKRVGGCFSPNRFDYVVDLEESFKFKCINNKYKKSYDKKKKEKYKRLQYLQGVIVSNSWIGIQCRNFWRNTNYELITGEYLQGDKTASILYSHKEGGFSPIDDLKEYELQKIIKGDYNE